MASKWQQAEPEASFEQTKIRVLAGSCLSAYIHVWVCAYTYMIPLWYLLQLNVGMCCVGVSDWLWAWTYMYAYTENWSSHLYTVFGATKHFLKFCYVLVLMHLSTCCRWTWEDTEENVHKMGAVSFTQGHRSSTKAWRPLCRPSWWTGATETARSDFWRESCKCLCLSSAVGFCIHS